MALDLGLELLRLFMQLRRTESSYKTLPPTAYPSEYGYLRQVGDYFGFYLICCDL